jgi:hypothetical protein
LNSFNRKQFKTKAEKNMWWNPPTTLAQEAIVLPADSPSPANYYGMDGCQWNARC